MLSFLRAQSPPRTKTSHLHTLHLENGRSKVSFSSATDLASKDTTILFTLPPCEPGPNPRDNSFLIPVIHFHPNQSETFRITYGTCVITCDGKKHICPAGESFTVKQYEYHSFANASSTEEMTLEASYDPPDRKREERFFRNLCGYLEDCSDKGKAMGTGASFPQIVAFAWEADIIACGPCK
jgi:mannose-6-phosphate isomerase-like protein (cupin superfamily)